MSGIEITGAFNAICDNYKELKETGRLDMTKHHKTTQALQAFLFEPYIEKKKVIKLQAQNQGMLVSSDLPIPTSRAFSVIREAPEYDLGYELAFARAFKDPHLTYWEAFDVTDDLQFSKVQEGQRLDVAGFQGFTQRAEIDYYGGAIGWTDKAIRYRQLGKMLQVANTFVNRYWTSHSDNHYALLATGAAANVTLTQGVPADGRHARNIQTINQAIKDLTVRLKDKGYGDMANAELLLYAHKFDEEVIESWFAERTNQYQAAFQNLGEGRKLLGNKITRIYTYTNRITQGQPWLVLPKRKIQRVQDMAPTTYNQEQDALTLNRVQAVWAIYGAAIFDTEQLQTVILA